MSEITDTSAAPVRYVDTSEGLRNLCDALRGADWIALDTEFMREDTYYPRLCLLQLATSDTIACVDPLALTVAQLDPLLDLLYDPAIIKVFHACSQDMEIFHLLRNELPAPVFDTQIAAPLLGYPVQASYARLVEDVLQVRLEKAHTRTDWSRRPLSPEQLDYAADDVRYLGPLYLDLRRRLGGGREIVSQPCEHAALFDRMTAATARRAAELGIDAATLASKGDLVDLIRGNEPCRLLSGWKRAAIGEELLKMRAG
jgi:ribonuclease D